MKLMKYKDEIDESFDHFWQYSNFTPVCEECEWVQAHKQIQRLPKLKLRAHPRQS